MINRFSIFLLAFLLFGTVHAAEVYTFVDQHCKIETGFIIDTDEDRVQLLNLDGKSSFIDKDSVRFVLSYDILENPIPRLYPSEQLNKNLRKIYVDQSDKPIFSGWPIKIIEDLVIFYDTNGNIQVIEMSKITKVEDDIRGFSSRPMVAKNHYFSPGDVSSCSNFKKKTKKSELIYPTRIYGDQIQIEEFLSNFQSNFIKFRSYQERTHLYAKPILFPKSTRLGINMNNQRLETPYNVMPIYVQWGSGEAYRFQSFYQIGGVAPEILPSVEPQSLIRSDLKSHIFHGSFIGNISALPAGTEFFSANGTGFYPLSKEQVKKVFTGTSLNYLALMGIDWRKWSLSVANYYPIQVIQVQNEFREIFATSSTPLFRLMYTQKNFRLRGIFAQSNYGASSNVNDTQIAIDNEQSVVGIISSYDLKNLMIRGGIDIDVSDDIRVSFDQIFTRGEYSETKFSSSNNYMDFQNNISQFKIEHHFGEYVNMFGTLTYFNLKQDYKFESNSGSDITNQFVVGGSFEFIF